MSEHTHTEARLTSQEAGEQAIFNHPRDGGDPSDPEDFRAAGVDVITDVLLALAAHGIDANAAHMIAWDHFVAERIGGAE